MFDNEEMETCEINEIPNSDNDNEVDKSSEIKDGVTGDKLSKSNETFSVEITLKNNEADSVETTSEIKEVTSDDKLFESNQAANDTKAIGMDFKPVKNLRKKKI